MTNEQTQLIPCPHCGGGVSIVKINGKWLIDCPTCERHHWEANVPCKYPGKEGLIEWWNTRHKRTCEIVSSMDIYDEYDHYVVCTSWELSCGHEIVTAGQDEKNPKPCFCDVCGAEVADD